MSNSIEQINAITGEGVPPAGDDWKAKCEALEKELQSQRVEHGRLKKTSDELEQVRKELAELKSAKENADLKSTLSKEELDAIPEEVLNAATKLVNTGMSRIKAENEERFRAMEKNREVDKDAAVKAKAETFLREIDERFPGFRADVSDGGDKNKAWTNYRKFNNASIIQSFNDGDMGTLAYHIKNFYENELGIPVPSRGVDGSAAPEPRTQGGGNGGQAQAPGKTYTQEEFIKLYDLLEEARDKGDVAERKRLEAEIEKAPAEGRVK